MSISLPVTSGNIGNIPQLTVDARALHKALGAKRDFSNWIKARIEKYGFVEGEDFEKSSMISNSPNLANGNFKGLRTPIEYRLTVNMGKELAMVENNERGRMVRRYFIECERRLQETPAPAVPPLSTTSDRRKLNNLVREWAALSGQSFPDCWAEIHIAFEIDAVADLPCTKVKEAEEWVRARIRDHGKPALDFKPELAVYGRKGNGEPVNLWDELKEAERILKGVAAGIALNCNSGSLSHMTAEKHLFHKILTTSADHAAASVLMAMQAVRTCLSVKSEVDFFKV